MNQLFKKNGLLKSTSLYQIKRKISYQAVQYSQVGLSEDTLQLQKIKIHEKLKPDQILVRTLASEINTGDLISLKGGIFGVPDSGIAGNSAIGVVEKVGSNVKKIKKGDSVVPIELGLGTWSEYFIGTQESLAVVSGNLGSMGASLVGASQAIAFHVLHDICNLTSNDSVIVDGANTAIGTTIAQIASSKGINVISILDSSVLNYKNAVKIMNDAGSKFVIDESSAGSSVFKKTVANLKPKLAVHCSSSSKTATDMARLLVPSGIIVSVTGAGPVTLPSSLLIEKGIKVQGFNLSTYLKGNGGTQTIKKLLELIKNNKIKPLIASVNPLSSFNSAIESLGHGVGSVLLKISND